MYEQNELYHHGIKGQKWYVRRFQNEDGTLTALGKARRGYQTAKESVKEAYSNHKVKRAVKTGNVRRLSDDELKRAIDRVAQEKKFKDLQKETQAVNKGRSIVGDILANGAKTIGDKAFKKLADRIFEDKTEKKEQQEADRISREAKNAENKTKIAQQKIALDKAEKTYKQIEQDNADQKRIEDADKKRYYQWLKAHK